MGILIDIIFDGFCYLFYDLVGRVVFGKDFKEKDISLFKKIGIGLLALILAGIVFIAVFSAVVYILRLTGVTGV